ncbi:unnamed protein product [Caenorhabditis nigoni]
MTKSHSIIPFIGLSIVVLVAGSFPGIYQRPILSSRQRYKSPIQTQEGWSPDPDPHPRGTHDVSTNYDPNQSPPDSSNSAHSPSDIHSSDTSDHDSAHSDDSAHSNADHHRIRRASDDPFETMVDRMEKISRVINGIALQQGLTNHSIPIDTLISELLNFDSVSPDDINEINAEELQSLVTEMIELPNLLNNGFDKTERIEKRFLMYALMLEVTEGIKNNVKIEGKDAYLKEVKDLKAENFAFTDWSHFEELLKLFNKIDTETRPTEFKSDLQGMSLRLNEIRDVNSSEFSNLTDFKNLRQSDRIFKPIYGIQKAIVEFQKFSAYDASKDLPPTETVKGYLKAIDSLAEKSKNNLAAFRVLDHILLKSRQPVRLSRKRSETPGFSNGFNDLDLVFSDLKDTWVKEVVEGQSDAFIKVLDFIRSLAKLTREVYDSSRFDSGVQAILSEVVDHALSLSELSGFFVDFVAHASDIALRALPDDMKADNSDKFNHFFPKIKTLSDILNAIDDVVQVYKTLASEEYQIKINKTLEITDFTVRTESAKRHDQLKKSQEATDIRNLIETVNPSIAILQNAVNFNQLLADIEAGFPEIDKFTTGLSIFFAKMDELRGRKGVELLKPAISTIQDFRDKKQDFGDFKKVTGQIPKIQEKLKALKTFISSFKPVESKENTELMKLPKVRNDSFIIGSSTLVFKSLKLASDRKVTMDKTDIDFVLNETSSVSQNLDPEDDKNLNKLDGLDQKLANFYRDVDRIKSSAEASDSSNLTSLDFTLAKSINGLSLDFGAIGRSVEKLSKASSKKKTELLEFKAKLDSLDSMGLDYASHQSAIGKSEDSLDEMELFFASFSSAMAPPAQNLTAPHNSSLTQSVVVNEQNGLSIYLGAALAGAVVLGLTGAGFYLVRRHYKNKRAHFDLPFSFGERLLRIILFKLAAVKLRLLGMQYSESFLYVRYCMELYEHDSKENYEENAGMVTPEFDYDKNTVRLNENNQIVLKDKKLFNLDYYHGNMIVFTDGFLVALCKTPRAGGLKDTRGPYWLAVAEKKARLCVCMGRISGDNPQVLPYFPREIGKEESYTGGKVKVKCMRVEQICSKTMNMLTLRVKIKGKRAFTTQMVVFEDCPDDKFPTLKSFNGLVELIDIVYHSKTPVFIACPTGTGYSAVFTLALYNRQEIMEKHGKVTMGSLLNEIRNFRLNAIENARQYLLALLLIIRDVMASMSKHQPVPNKDVIQMNKDIDEIFEASERLDATYTKMIEDEQKMKQGGLRIETIEVPKKVPKAPKASKAQKASKAPTASKAPNAPKATTTQQAPIAPDASKTQDTQDTQKTLETLETQDTQEAPAAAIAPSASTVTANEPEPASSPTLTARMELKPQNVRAPTREPWTLAKQHYGLTEAQANLKKKEWDAAEAARRATDDPYPHGMGLGLFRKRAPAVPKGMEMERTQDGEELTKPKKKKNKKNKKKKAMAEEGMTICDDGMTMCDDEEMKEVKVEIPIAPAPTAPSASKPV